MITRTYTAVANSNNPGRKGKKTRLESVVSVFGGGYLFIYSFGLIDRAVVIMDTGGGIWTAFSEAPF